jgi:hypothetical protein
MKIQFALLNYLAVTLIALIGIRLDSSTAMSISDENSVDSILPTNAIDSFEFGTKQAKEDLKIKSPKYFARGLISNEQFNKFQEYGVEVILIGCMINRIGIEYLKGYNSQIEKELFSRHKV